MFPSSSGAWLFILIACAIGFAIGQWIKSRRKKADKNNEYINGLKKRLLAEQLAKAKKTGKKNRRGNKKGGGS
ncbi:MAG: hypothetical protein M0009_14305 [Deltaproteobacteria bacterium]|nr:hypothetical protein [Deltaproteobacteria bacterium]MDA8126347.1 hypothetical protein [Deltaproteobacteria bacterium]